MTRILLGWSFVLVGLLYPLPGFANSPDLILPCDSAIAAMSGYLKLDSHGIENRTRAAQSLWTKAIGLLGTVESALLDRDSQTYVVPFLKPNQSPPALEAGHHHSIPEKLRQTVRMAADLELIRPLGKKALLLPENTSLIAALGEVEVIEALHILEGRFRRGSEEDSSSEGCLYAAAGFGGFVALSCGGFAMFVASQGNLSQVLGMEVSSTLQATLGAAGVGLMAGGMGLFAALAGHAGNRPHFSVAQLVDAIRTRTQRPPQTPEVVTLSISRNGIVQDLVFAVDRTIGPRLIFFQRPTQIQSQ